MLNAMQESGKFNITILSRSKIANAAPGMKAVTIDYNDAQSLTSALSGQDALVCTLSRSAVPCQIALIDAAVVAGVQRFIPSEFGANLNNENCRRLFNYREKVKVQEYLEQKVEQSSMTYTYIYTNVLMDWSLEAGILLDLCNAKACLYDGGNKQVSMCTMPAVGKAVVGVLLNYEATMNRAIYVHEAVISQKALLSYAMKVTPHLQWRHERANLEDLQDGRQRKQTRSSDLSTFHVGAMKAAFSEGFGNSFDVVDNKLLGIEMMSESDLMSLIRSLLERIV